MRERPWRQNMTATLLFLVNFALSLLLVCEGRDAHHMVALE